MIWRNEKSGDGSGGWLQCDTPVGEWVIDDYKGDGFAAIWFPAWCSCCEVTIGKYKTQGAAKGAAKRYAKRMAAAFKEMGRAGWK